VREAAGLLVIDLSQLEHLDGQALYEFVRASHVTRHLGAWGWRLHPPIRT
jgi:anti-anti-sigma regulatory factor